MSFLKVLSLYILAFFVKDKVSIGVWVYLWAFYLVPLVYISGFFFNQYHTVLMTIALQYSLNSGRLIPSASFFFLKIALAIWGLLCFHYVKAIGDLIGIALNLQIALGREKTVSSISGAGKTGQIHVKGWNWNPSQYHTQKNPQNGLKT